MGIPLRSLFVTSKKVEGPRAKFTVRFRTNRQWDADGVYFLVLWVPQVARKFLPSLICRRWAAIPLWRIVSPRLVAREGLADEVAARVGGKGDGADGHWEG
jgi:hypothetical protein